MSDDAVKIGCITTWFCRTGMWTVLIWTVGASLVTGLGLALMRKGKIE